MYLDHVASGIVHANHSIMWMAEIFRQQKFRAIGGQNHIKFRRDAGVSRWSC